MSAARTRKKSFSGKKKDNRKQMKDEKVKFCNCLAVMKNVHTVHVVGDNYYCILCGGKMKEEDIKRIIENKQ